MQISGFKVLKQSLATETIKRCFRCFDIKNTVRVFESWRPTLRDIHVHIHKHTCLVCVF